MYYPCSENKGDDQLRGYREADLRLCFRLCKLLVFSCTGSFNSRNCWKNKIDMFQFFQIKIPVSLLAYHFSISKSAKNNCIKFSFKEIHNLLKMQVTMGVHLFFSDIV